MSLIVVLRSMFYSAQAFSRDISNFDTSKVTDMSHMFLSAWAFDQSLCNWDISSVHDDGHEGLFLWSGFTQADCSCVAGRYRSFDKFCNKCVVGKYVSVANSVSESDCLVCEAGKFTTKTGTITCTDCQEGKHLKDAATSSSLHDEETDCTNCDLGKYIGTVGNSDCLLCTTGRYTDSVGTVNCLGCPDGKATAIAASIATAYDSVEDCTSEGCPAGSKGVDGIISECPPGSFSSSGSPSCSLCVGASVTASPGQESCTYCSGDNLANAEKTACLSSSTCEIGSGLTVDAASCQICQFGTFSGVDSAARCDFCPVGKSTASESSTSISDCVFCGTGRYNENGVGGICTACIAGNTTLMKAHIM